MGLFLIVFFVADVTRADIVKARGAASRKHFSELQQVDIEDVIRAEEDPDFLQYLKDREHQKKLEEAAYLDNKKQRQAEQAAYEQARIHYINNEYKNVDVDESRQEEQYIKQQMASQQQQEKYRREYVINQQNQEEKANIERMARIQKAFSPERMPASGKK
ncbi:MAG: hypothetical protein SGI74_07635 [Oligoflexia bacterium]|nr:hypothetical protein [Oligoflexia bacterium]